MTIVELLVALMITSIVTTITFAGFVSFLQANQRNEQRIDQEMLLSNTLNFLKDEVQLASVLAEEPMCPTEWCDPVLEIHSDRLEHPILIYLDTVEDAEGGLSGTKGIYRFGPRFDIDGNYEANWSTELLLDGLRLGEAVPEGVCGDEVSLPAGTTEFFACTQEKLTTLSLRSPQGESLEVTVFPRL